MKLVSKILKGSKYALTSSFGYRKPITTSAGVTASFHAGCDYGTYGVKAPQYAVESGKIISCGTASDGGKYIWVEYPRLGIKCQHYHLDSICVKTGQSVDNNTILGYTGKTGKATGIHLHLGLKNIGGSTWLDAEKYDYVEGTEQKASTNFLGARGYIKLGDQGDNVAKISSFMYKTFPAYTNKKALGNYYGPYIKASITEFQKRTKLEADGCVGPITLAKLKKYGFEE